MRTSLIASALCLSLIAGPVAAQQAEGPTQPAPSAAQKELGQLQSRIKELRSELQDIQSSALENHPELKKQRNELQTLIRDTIKKNGVDVDKRVQQMRDMRKQAQSGDISQEEKQALAKKFQKTRSSLQQAQQKAMQSEAVQKARQAFEQALMTAMKESNGETEALVKELREKQTQFRKMLMKKMQQKRSGGNS